MNKIDQESGGQFVFASVRWLIVPEVDGVTVFCPVLTSN